MSGIGAVGSFGGMGVSISGIGGAGGVGGLGATSGVAGAGAAGGAGAVDLTAALPPNLQTLVQTIQDFSSAEILMALMIASAGEKKDKKSCGGSSGAAGLLAGMALAGMMAQQPKIGLQLDASQITGGAGIPGGIGGGGGVGISLNISF